MIAFECSSCGKSLKVKDELAGKKVKCPGCQKPVGVPQPAASISPPPAVREDERTLPPKTPSPGEERTLPPKEAGKKESISDAGGLTDLGAGKRETTQAFPATEHSAELTDFLAPPQQPDEIGRLGPFRVLKILGAGGMGVVYKAEDPQLKRPVALKAMLPTLGASESARKRFLREAQAAAAIVHDHIVPIHQVGEDRGIPFVAMQFLEGEPLDERLKREPLTVMDILRIGRETAEGLAAAHKRGLIHRDIKPANLWLEGDKGRVKILDFGLARAAADDSHLTQTGAIVGTPAYMAPEQAGGEKVDHRCDLFSLGCVLYRLCTGNMPFKGKDSISTLIAVASQDPPRPVSINLELPTELSDLVMQLLAKKPEERPASAQAVVEALQEIEKQIPDTTVRLGQKTQKVKVAGKSKTEAAPTPTAPGAKKRFPLPWLVGGGVLGLGLLLVAIVLFWQTPHGTVRIESDDPSVEIVFDKTGPTIKGAGKEPISLRAGAHGIQVKHGDFIFETDKLVIKKGQLTALKVELLGSKLRLVQDGQVIASGDVPVGKLFTNGLGMEFVLVPKGKALLGGGGGNPGTKDVDIPYDFYLGRYEVTQEELEKVMGLVPSHFSRGGGNKEMLNIALADLQRFPVEQVTWDDCQVFIERLNKQVKEPGWVYRLPTEVEWEYACRGGPMKDKLESAFDFYFEKPTNSLLPDQANFAHGKGLKRTCKVGSYQPNRLGLYDMHGNVWEWCQDELKVDKGASQRVARGGSWFHDSGYCRAAARNAHGPGYRHDSLGLRLARVPVGKELVKSPAMEYAPLAKEGQWKQVLTSEADFKLLSAAKAFKGGVGQPKYDGKTLELNTNGHLFTPYEATDGIIRAKIKRGSSRNVALGVRGGVVLWIGNNNIVGVGTHVDGRYVDLKTVPLSKPPEDYVDLALAAVGPNIAGFLDGRKILEATDPNPQRGVLLVHANGGTGFFRDIEIQILDKPGPGGKSAAAFRNALGMEFVLVPKGKSWLGGGGGKMGDKEVEILNDFYLGKYEVTQAEWEKVTGLNPSYFSRTGGGKELVKDISEADLKRFPVEMVSWEDAEKFVKTLNEMSKEAGWIYRLPKEVEWEYACRGGPMLDGNNGGYSAFDYYFDEPTNKVTAKQANMEDGKGLKRTAKVGSYPANRLGLHDMHGNVTEWCHDARVIRGGNWEANECRAASRFVSQSRDRHKERGLRLARVPVGKELVTIPDTAGSKIENLDGEWQGLELHLAGVLSPKDKAERRKLIISGKRYTLSTDQFKIEGAFNSDPTTNPKSLHFIPEKGGSPAVQGKPQLGIYTVAGDTLKFCVGAPNGTRPTIFDSTPQGWSVQVYRRVTKDLKATFKNSLGMEFVLVPKGMSWLGGGGGKPGDKEVEIKEDFYLGKYEVTQEEWAKVLATRPSHFGRLAPGKEAVKDIPDEELRRFPVEMVSWDDAQLFLAELNKRDKVPGWKYRLPKSVEWEYACRGGPMTERVDSTFNYYLEKPTDQLLPTQANFEHGDKSLKRPSRVGSYKPNILGLYDMHGNVHEWCDDREEGGEGRMCRGAGWMNPAEPCKANFCNAFPRMTRHFAHGIRLARVPVGKESK